ncbi:MAG: ATP-binding protein [Planctomycetota bacterium]
MSGLISNSERARTLATIVGLLFVALVVRLDRYLRDDYQMMALALLPGILLGIALSLRVRSGLLFALAGVVIFIAEERWLTDLPAGETYMRAVVIFLEVGTGIAMANWLSTPVRNLGRPASTLILGLALPLGLPLAFAATSFATMGRTDWLSFGESWTADAAGLLLGLPTMVLWLKRPRRRGSAGLGQAVWLLLGVTGAFLLASWVEPARPTLAYLVFPFQILLVNRVAPSIGASTFLVTSAGFAVLALSGLGPFAIARDSRDALIDLQLFLGASGLCLWAGICARFGVVPREDESDSGSDGQMRGTVSQEASLVEADKLIALGGLASGLAHEINNPNQFISLNAPLLRDIWREARPILDAHAAREEGFRLGNLPYSEMREEVSQLIDEITQGSQRIHYIMSELRNYIRPDDSGSRTSLDMNRVVRSTMTLLESTIRKRTSQFTLDLYPDKLIVTGNFARLQQVLINLVLNACQALQDRSEALEVSTSSQEEWAVVTIADSGAGISPEHLPRVTDPFFTTRRTEGATGLGLAVALRIVKAHDGTIEFQSEAGRGTVVTLRVPLGSGRSSREA